MQAKAAQANGTVTHGKTAIRERTKAGLASAHLGGRIGGNPGLRARNPEALRKVRLARHDGYMERIAQTAADWVPHVRRLRPHMSSPPRADNVATLVGQDAAGTG